MHYVYIYIYIAMCSFCNFIVVFLSVAPPMLSIKHLYGCYFVLNASSTHQQLQSLALHENMYYSFCNVEYLPDVFSALCIISGVEKHRV